MDEKVLHELALFYVKQKIGESVPTPARITQLYLEAKQDIIDYLNKNNAPIDDGQAPPWPE